MKQVSMYALKAGLNRIFDTVWPLNKLFNLKSQRILAFTGLKFDFWKFTCCFWNTTFECWSKLSKYYFLDIMSGIYLNKRKLIYCGMKCFSLSNLRNIEINKYYCLQERIAIFLLFNSLIRKILFCFYPTRHLDEKFATV